MFERKSDTGWFKYEMEEVPSEVIEHIVDRNDTINLNIKNNEITFYSKNGFIDLYDENGNDGFKDYGVMTSKPVNYPEELPNNIRNNYTVEEYFEDEDIIELVKAIKISDDPRNHIMQNTLRFDIPSKINLINIH